jgi:hypothetical protein
MRVWGVRRREWSVGLFRARNCWDIASSCSLVNSSRAQLTGALFRADMMFDDVLEHL